jgi:DNA (cytosine-5)-methyltransferase 1
MSSSDPIPLIDVFAGPGGLSEGFAALRSPSGEPVFQIALSVEMDFFAHQTLLLRSFVRQFAQGRLPDEYYAYVRGRAQWSGARLDQLLDQFGRESARARDEAWRWELAGGASARMTDVRIRSSLARYSGDRPWGLIGGPPCQAYSLVGRSRMLPSLGQQFYADKRHLLYQEYLRLLDRHSPAFFVFENVKGLLSSKLRDGSLIFQRILDDLHRPRRGLRYELFALASGDRNELDLGAGQEDPSSFVVRAELHGVPQARHRVIIFGVREDCLSEGFARPGRLSAMPAPSVQEVLGSMPMLRSGLSSDGDSPEVWVKAVKGARTSSWFDQLDRRHEDVAQVIAQTLRHLQPPESDRGGRFIPGPLLPAGALTKWLSDSRVKGILNHESRGHRIDDLHRYLFASSFGRAREKSPQLRDFPRSLLPAHRNVSRALAQGAFGDRFRVQVADRYSTTITSHISKDGHAFIHPDPSQCRSLTVREAARLQTFPDNYFFEGPRTEQYRQVGNAVPPLLANQIARIAAEMIHPAWRRLRWIA